MLAQNPLDRIDQIDAMRMGVDYRLQIALRGFKIFVRPLTVGETVQVAANVSDRLSKLPISARTALHESVAIAKETLQQASTSEPGKFDPSLTEYILDKMTPDELNTLFKQYVEVCNKVNPSLEQLPTEEIKALVERIKKKDLELTELSFLEAVNLCRHLLIPGE